MFYSRTVNNKLNHLHERCLRIVYSDKKSSFKKLLKIDLSQYTLEIYRSLQQFFKESKDLAPIIFSDIFSKQRSV